MIIDISAETGRVLREELRNGHFRSVDHLILSGVQAWLEKTVRPQLLQPRRGRP